ncbi:MAG: sialate O-acetylesterase [Bacteroidota bacterium]|nr:sialate O-acetylesterase [Bacteroidota bacterium]
MKYFLFIVSFFAVMSYSSAQNNFSGHKLDPQKVWVFILAGQSNMSGRGKVEAQDTVSTPRVLSINKKGEIVAAREPLNFNEPKMQGLGCGLAFGKEMLNDIPDDVSILVLQTAVGGSSINQWITNSTHRGIPLFSNFKYNVEIGKQYGTIKAILWHQGESDANPEGIRQRQNDLSTLFKMFRSTVGNDSLPVLLGDLGSFSKTPALFSQINEQNRIYAASDRFTSVISTSDLHHRGDSLHFNSEGQREMGKRFAHEYIRKFGAKKPIVVLTFDDGSVTHYYNVAPLLKKYGFTATFFVCDYPRKPEVAASKNMTWNQIQALDKMGFEIGNHTGHHKGVGNLTKTELVNEIKYIEDKCKAYGISKPVSFAYPGNRSDSAARIVLKEMGYVFARVGGSRYFNPETDDRLLIPSYTMTDKLDEKSSRALQELRPGQILIFTIHEVPDPDHENYTTAPELLEKYLKLMSMNHDEVIAMKDLVKYCKN